MGHKGKPVVMEGPGECNNWRRGNWVHRWWESNKKPLSSCGGRKLINCIKKPGVVKRPGKWQSDLQIHVPSGRRTNAEEEGSTRHCTPASLCPGQSLCQEGNPCPPVLCESARLVRGDSKDNKNSSMQHLAVEWKVLHYPSRGVVSEETTKSTSRQLVWSDSQCFVQGLNLSGGWAWEEENESKTRTWIINIPTLWCLESNRQGAGWKG